MEEIHSFGKGEDIMKMKKALALTMTAVMATASLTACGGQKAPAEGSAASSTPAASSEAPAASSEAPAESSEAQAASPADLGDVTIKVSTWDVDSTPYVTSIVDAFQTKYPNIKVELSDTASADYTNKLSIMLNGGSDVDVFWVKDADTIKALSDKGQLADLSEFISRDGVDLAAYNGLAENFKFDGKVVGLPSRTDYYVLYYNKDIFDAANVAYPTNDMTWEDFEATAKAITSGEGANKKYGALIHTWQACVENWRSESVV